MSATAFQIDGGATLAYSAPFVVSMPGTHSISFHSTDNAGNVETAHANVFTVVPLPCDVNADGSMNVIDIQIIILEALGMAPAVNDLDHDHVVNVADVQTVVRAALGFGCPNNP